MPIFVSTDHMNQELKKCPICDGSFSSQMSRYDVTKHIDKCKIESRVDQGKKSAPLEVPTESEPFLK